MLIGKFSLRLRSYVSASVQVSYIRVNEPYRNLILNRDRERREIGILNCSDGTTASARLSQSIANAFGPQLAVFVLEILKSQGHVRSQGQVGSLAAHQVGMTGGRDHGGVVR